MVNIRKIQNRDEICKCAELMTDSEPWITLGRSYEDSIKILSDSTKEVYVGISSDILTGFIIIDMNGPFRGYLQTVCIKPEWRNKGIGSKLIKFAEERIFRESPNVFMCVSSFNKEAQKLYNRLGYMVAGELTDYIVPGHSEILLRKTTGPMSTFIRVF